MFEWYKENKTGVYALGVVLLCVGCFLGGLFYGSNKSSDLIDGITAELDTARTELSAAIGAINYQGQTIGTLETSLAERDRIIKTRNQYFIERQIIGENIEKSEQRSETIITEGRRINSKSRTIIESLIGFYSQER